MVALAEETLHGRLFTEQRHDYVAVARAVLTVDHHVVAGQDAGVAHALPGTCSTYSPSSPPATEGTWT